MSVDPIPTTVPDTVELTIDTEGNVKVMPTQEALRNAVITAISGLATSEETEQFCLYVLRAMKSPALIESDLTYLKVIEDQLREERLRSAQVKRWLGKALVALGAGVTTYVATLLPNLL